MIKQSIKIACLVLVIVTFFLEVTYSQTKKMCVTIDDLPVVPYSIKTISHKWLITKGIVDTLKKYNVPAIGYVNEKKIYTNNELDSTKYELLEYWLMNNLELGNHTFSHLNYHKSSFNNFTSDLIKGEKVSKLLCAKYGKEFKYFRHPFLKSGSSKLSSDSLSQFLIEKGYVESPVTIDNEEYIYAHAFHLAFVDNNTSLMKRIGDSYLEYMEEKLLYFEKISESVYNRKIDQTLLIHANLLNANYLGELLKMYSSYGYIFIDQQTVLNDSTYNTEVTKFGDWGISWLERWAMSLEKGKHIFKEDPMVPEFIHELRKK